MSKFLFLSLFILTSLNADFSSLDITPPLNVIYHPVSTKIPEAQKSFDNGLTYIFAFNHDLAYREFENASKIDPDLAMAYWGMALALGQNINSDVTPENEIRAFELMQKARSRAVNAWPEEQAYINALTVRYTNDKSADFIPLRYKYHNAMKKVKDAYPQDLDAATLYAESILDLDPWKYWTLDGKAKEGTWEAIDVLESVLRRNPDHIGANHYLIHAYEASPFPERALMSAHRLETLLIESGHLLHMPCHIFILTGDYDSALKTNLKAINADKAYISKYGIGGNYPVHYLAHNMYVLTRIYMLMENYPKAIEASLNLQQFLVPHYKEMPSMAHFGIAPIEINLYFHKWNEILNFKPVTDAASVLAYWHYSRATAFAELNDLDSAQAEWKQMKQAQERIAKDEVIGGNPASKVIDLAEIVLQATFAKVQNNVDLYVDLLKRAVAFEEQLFYDEPPAWFTPIRQTLGAALIKQGRYAEAELMFQKTLQKLQRNGRSLFGLLTSLKAQGKRMDAYWVEREMKASLQNASQPLTLDLL